MKLLLFYTVVQGQEKTKANDSLLIERGWKNKLPEEPT